MKTLTKIFVLSMLMAFVACQQNDEAAPDLGQGEITFSYAAMNEEENSGGRIAAAVPAKIVVSIESTSGESMYVQEELAVVEFNGSYISLPISLPVGDYLLTEYFVKDDAGNIIYVTPQAGSDLAYLVADPLAISFSIAEDETNQMVQEVLSTAGVSAGDFGYTDFSFNVVETFDFLMSVHYFDEAAASYKLTDANVEIFGDGVEIYNKTIADTTDQIRVPDGYIEYMIITSKNDFVTDTTTLDNSTLKSHLLDPLLVVLQPSPIPAQVTDIDGNVYGTVQIGNQVWLDKNLSVTNFNDGSPIAEVTAQAAWVSLETPAYSWWGNDPSFALNDEYGALYNYDVAASGNVCPTGWRVPTEDDWNTLLAEVGDSSSYKLAGTDLWSSAAFESESAFGQSGFDFVPNGYRSPFDYGGTQPEFLYNGTSGQVWSQTPKDGAEAYYLTIFQGNSQAIVEDGLKVAGFGIRCIMD